MGELHHWQEEVGEQTKRLVDPVHEQDFSKDILDRTPRKLQAELKVALTDQYTAPDPGEATARKNHLIERYQEKPGGRNELNDTDRLTA
ncbi:MAG: hypothetical protein WAW16_00540 [Candidatus Cryosericum sp.]